MLYELHIANDLRDDYMLCNHNKIVDKEFGLFREWSMETPPMLNYSRFLIMALKCSKMSFLSITQKQNVV